MFFRGGGKGGGIKRLFGGGGQGSGRGGGGRKSQKFKKTEKLPKGWVFYDPCNTLVVTPLV